MNSTLWLSLALCLGLLACFQTDPGQARSPRWGKDTCAVCRMAVTDPPHAAQLVGPGAQVRHYDDLGCALGDLARNERLQGARLYVVAPGTREAWVEAHTVRYAAGQRTPMNYGYSPSVDGELGLEEVKAQLQRRAAPPAHHEHPGEGKP